MRGVATVKEGSPKSSRPWLYLVVGCLSVLVLLLMLVGMWIASVPIDRRAVSKLELDLAPELVWATVTDRSFQERSNNDLGFGFVRVDEAGEVVEMGPSEYSLDASPTGTPMTCVVSMGGGSLWSKSWTWKLEPAKGGTIVVLEEHLVRRSILTRAFAVLQRSDRDEWKYTEVDQFLRSLADTHGVDAAPVHVQ